MAKLGDTDLDVRGINLGGNVFGWTADEQRSFAVLDAYTAAGGNFIDTADVYSGGESETIIGNWLARRGRRDDVVIATKVGMWEQRKGLSAANIAASNYSAERLTEALAISGREGLARYVALQPHYNLMERDYERDLAPAVEREGLTTLPYFSLAKGFLTGKYRSAGNIGDSPRAARASSYLDERGERVLAALDEIAAAQGVSVAAVSLAWLFAQPTVTAPIASARTVEQLNDLLPAAELQLTADEVEALTIASS